MGRTAVTAEEWATRPRCNCHDEPMYKSGSNWQCAVKGRENARRRYFADPQAAHEKARRWRAANADKIITYDKRTKYGVTPDEFQRMLQKQGGLCAICGCTADEIKGARNFSIDHNHATGAVRGLLCRKCNSGIAYLGDTADGVRRALEYLEGAE